MVSRPQGDVYTFVANAVAGNPVDRRGCEMREHRASPRRVEVDRAREGKVAPIGVPGRPGSSGNTVAPGNSVPLSRAHGVLDGTVVHAFPPHIALAQMCTTAGQRGTTDLAWPGLAWPGPTRAHRAPCTLSQHNAAPVADRARSVGQPCTSFRDHPVAALRK